MKSTVSLLLIVMLAGSVLLPGCSERKDIPDFYILQELETISQVKKPEKKIERFKIFINNHADHPYRVLAAKRLFSAQVEETGDMAGALSSYDDILQREKDPLVRGKLYYGKFEALWEVDRDRAVDLARELLRSEESYHKLFLYMGYYFLYGEDEELAPLAEKCFLKAIENTDDTFQKNHVRMVYGEYLNKQDRKEEAYAVLSQASEYAFANEILGGYLWEDDRREDALAAYIKLVAGVPGTREGIKLDSLYALVHPGLGDLEDKISKSRIIDKGMIPDMDFVDIRGHHHNLRGYRGTKLVITAFSPT
ncbi:MAG: hypothetical protein JXB45_04500 [Candidatus Krumholzibacteriota bacterium]|nr:hypothetical protein [Candidatus Krumholzibacteriota bacterium]